VEKILGVDLGDTRLVTTASWRANNRPAPAFVDKLKIFGCLRFKRLMGETRSLVTASKAIKKEKAAAMEPFCLLELDVKNSVQGDPASALLIHGQNSCVPGSKANGVQAEPEALAEGFWEKPLSKSNGFKPDWIGSRTALNLVNGCSALLARKHSYGGLC